MAKAGPKDEYPQFLRGVAVQQSANAEEKAEVITNVPIAQGNDVFILNVLRVLWEAQFGDFEDGSAVDLTISTVNYLGSPPYDSPGVIFRELIKTVGAGGDTERMTGNHPLHDGNGHGVLVASSKIWMYCASVGQNAAVSFRAAIEYTLVKVKGVELAGIVSFA